KRGIECLEVLYQSLVNEIKNRGYLQADETPIKVLTSEKKGATHQGYFWVYHDPFEQSIVFDYQATRGYA
ncbi:transposase, partial [uncultured Microscilla sp.]